MIDADNTDLDAGQTNGRGWIIATIAAAIVACSAFGYFVWLEKQPTGAPFTGVKISASDTRAPNPSEATKKIFETYVDKHDNIAGINIIKVDFRQNTRSTTYRYFKDQSIEAAWAGYIHSHDAPPLFGSDEASNQRMVNLINGQFSCVKITQTAAGQLIPGLKDVVTDVCLVPIPPGYGDFIGFINIFLKHSPSGIEVSQIEKDSEKLSIDMYEKDIVKSRVRFNTENFGKSNYPTQR